jgi:mono/diheme cytochrome c family protein
MELGVHLIDIAVVLGGLLWAHPAANAQEMGDLIAGRAFAREVCASCHSVEPSQTASNASAPSFQQVADTPGMTATALTVWLQTSHPTMPNIQLTQAEKRDVIAYIVSLRTTRD